MALAVCLFVRDEERDLAEWLAFQFATGFNACLVYDNASVDRTPEIVRSFAQCCDARLINWPQTEKSAQVACYADCLERFGREFDWIAFIDADELIVPQNGTIIDLLKTKQNVAAVAINWSMSGSSGIVCRPPGLMSTTFTRRSDLDFLPNTHVKSIVRPQLAIRPRTPHAFDVLGEYCCADGGAVEWAMLA